ncbi:histidine phosphatase superfamily [Russula earlei]|uniref:Histidine phosphatase superfamily n=1 Tax=Russula earlei TaxID=71964 RepID=A0ACC0ULU3_9AGAM|nr:histidine phosphatase superfamily [Russula earlei]
MSVRRKYEAIRGFFDQDEPSAVPTVIGPTPEFFGLKSRSWPKLIAEIDELCSKSSDPGVSYKVFFFGRHGEGFHNAAITQYGQQAWDEKWGLLDGDGKLIWGPDPRLTAIGEDQARNAHAAWKREIAHGIPVPHKFYCSPLKRALRTLELTFEGFLPVDPKPIILENCREHYGRHSCDKRSTRSALQSEFPNFVFEEGFEEEDVLYSAERETEANLQRRAKLVLDRIFEKDDDTYISVTAHCGWIRGALHTIGREIYELPTGGTIVAVVKGTVI